MFDSCTFFENAVDYIVDLLVETPKEYGFDFSGHNTDTACLEPGVRESDDLVVHIDDAGYITPIMSAISDVKVVKDKVVIMTFADGTQEKAVCAEEDPFSVDEGISICLTKKLLSDMCCESTGTGIYNNLVRLAKKKVGAAQKAEQRKKDVLKAERAERKAEHDRESERNRHDRQYTIDMLAEAIRKAFSAPIMDGDASNRHHITLLMDDGK